MASGPTVWVVQLADRQTVEAYVVYVSTDVRKAMDQVTYKWSPIYDGPHITWVAESPNGRYRYTLTQHSYE